MTRIGAFGHLCIMFVYIEVLNASCTLRIMEVFKTLDPDNN